MLVMGPPLTRVLEGRASLRLVPALFENFWVINNSVSGDPSLHTLRAENVKKNKNLKTFSKNLGFPALGHTHTSAWHSINSRSVQPHNSIMTNPFCFSTIVFGSSLTTREPTWTAWYDYNFGCVSQPVCLQYCYFTNDRSICVIQATST